MYKHITYHTLPKEFLNREVKLAVLGNGLLPVKGRDHLSLEFYHKKCAHCMSMTISIIIHQLCLCMQHSEM
jgi:hypothetical protein